MKLGKRKRRDVSPETWKKMAASPLVSESENSSVLLAKANQSIQSIENNLQAKLMIVTKYPWYFLGAVLCCISSMTGATSLALLPLLMLYSLVYLAFTQLDNSPRKKLKLPPPKSPPETIRVHSWQLKDKAGYIDEFVCLFNSSGKEIVVQLTMSQSIESSISIDFINGEIHRDGTPLELANYLCLGIEKLKRNGENYIIKNRRIWGMTSRPIRKNAVVKVTTTMASNIEILSRSIAEAATTLKVDNRLAYGNFDSLLQWEKGELTFHVGLRNGKFILRIDGTSKLPPGNVLPIISSSANSVTLDLDEPSYGLAKQLLQLTKSFERHDTKQSGPYR